MIYDEEHYNQVLAVARSYRNDVERLEKQLAITEKSLELACEHMCKFIIPCPNVKCGAECYKNKKDCYCDYFKTKAKEILENE